MNKLKGVPIVFLNSLDENWDLGYFEWADFKNQIYLALARRGVELGAPLFTQ